jgi:hypothetical protein
MNHHFHQNRPPARTPPAKDKPTLEMIHLPIFQVHYLALEEYLSRVYRIEDFDFLFASGVTPGTIVEYVVSGKLPPSDDYRRQADTIRAGRRVGNVALILNVLCIDGYIPAGKYLFDTRPKPTLLESYRRLLRQTGTPQSKECTAFRRLHAHDKTFTRQAAEIDTQMLSALRNRQAT